jgi:hypothetical protein
MSTAESSSPKSTEAPVIDVEPFGYELKAEWLRRNEKYSVVSQKTSLKSGT